MCSGRGARGQAALDRAQRLQPVVQLVDAPLAVAQLLRLALGLFLDAPLFGQLGLQGLSGNNGLSPDENTLLFQATSVDEAIALILKGLGRAAPNPRAKNTRP